MSQAMFSAQQKREIADAVQKILRATNHPELPSGEINFALHVDGAEAWSWADIRNNGGVTKPGVNPWNEAQDPRTAKACDKLTGGTPSASELAATASVPSCAAPGPANVSGARARSGAGGEREEKP